MGWSDVSVVCYQHFHLHHRRVRIVSRGMTQITETHPKIHDDACRKNISDQSKMLSTELIRPLKYSKLCCLVFVWYFQIGCCFIINNGTLTKAVDLMLTSFDVIWGRFWQQPAHGRGDSQVFSNNYVILRRIKLNILEYGVRPQTNKWATILLIFFTIISLQLTVRKRSSFVTMPEQVESLFCDSYSTLF